MSVLRRITSKISDSDSEICLDRRLSLSANMFDFRVHVSLEDLCFSDRITEGSPIFPCKETERGYTLPSSDKQLPRGLVRGYHDLGVADILLTLD